MTPTESSSEDDISAILKQQSKPTCSVDMEIEVKVVVTRFQRNFAHGACLIMSIREQIDMKALRCISSEPCEHAFGMLRQNERDFSISQIMDLIDSIVQRTTLMLK